MLEQMAVWAWFPFLLYMLTPCGGSCLTCSPQVPWPRLGIDPKEKAEMFWPSAMENAILDAAVTSNSGRIAPMSVANFQ